MNTSRLNPDILTEVIPHLSSRDALRFGSTCSFLRPISVRHAVRDVSFGSATHLAKFSAFMFAVPSRLPYLRALTIGPDIVNAPAALFAAPFPLAKLISRAPNLAHLSPLSCAELLLTVGQILEDAITSRTHLTSLRLSTWGAGTQDVILNMRCAPTLEELVLAEEDYSRVGIQDNMRLPSLPALHTLCLSGISALPPRATLAALAPRLRTLRLRNVQFMDPDPEPHLWWSALDTLRGDISSLAFLRFSRPVRTLEVDGLLANEHPWDPSVLFDVLQMASPLCLSIGMQASFEQPFWETYAPALARVQCLRLVVDRSSSDMRDSDDWLESLAAPGPPTLLAAIVYVHIPSGTGGNGIGAIQQCRRALDTFSKSLRELELFGFAVGSDSVSVDKGAIFCGEKFSWWKKVESHSEHDDENDGTAGSSHTEKIEWLQCSWLEGGRAFDDILRHTPESVANTS